VTATDVLVVGAGPAGIAAALAAHDAGLDVIVVDRAEFPRDKTCGDGLTAGALRLLERLHVDVPALAGYASVRETVLVSPSGRHVTLPLPADGDHSVVVPRADLDAALVARARAVGVDLHEHAEVVGLEQTDDRVLVRFADDQTLEVAHVIAADGHWSSVRRACSSDEAPDLGTWHAFRQYFHGVNEERQWVLFERDLLPGYAWVFPLAGGRANVGLGVLRERGTSGKQLANLWRDVIGRPTMQRILGADAEPDDSVRAWPIPASYDKSRLSDGRVLYAGDAAAVVDPMTGEGIAQALETGALAAAAIAVGGTPAEVARHYADTVDRAVGRDLRFAGALQRILRSPFGARAAIRAADLTAWTRRNFARWMFEDYPRAVLLTPDRWRRGMFTPPGAYRAA
jgi:geranylgeranyl reductase family protein